MRVRNVLSALALCAVIVPVRAQADGMVIAPPNSWIEETGQRAVIMHENGVETMVLSTSFQGDAKDFAWIVPTPSQPTVSKGTQEAFTNLQKLTQVSDVPQPLGLGGVRIENVGSTSDVTVIEEKQVDYYDVAVLSATDKDALANWLKEKGYNFPEAASYLLQEYINNQWYFVAMRVNPESLAFTNVNQQLRSGGATPVVLRFATERIVYPLRISTALQREEKTTSTYPNTFVEGKFSRALYLSEDDAVVHTGGDAFPLSEGSVEAYVKFLAWDASRSYYNVLTVKDQAGAEMMHLYVSKSGQTQEIQLQWQGFGDPRLKWRAPAGFELNTWHHIAATWKAGSPPQLYMDGAPLVTIAVQKDALWSGRAFGAGGSQIIGRFSSAKLTPAHIDEFSVWKRQLTAAEIQSHAATALVADASGAYPVDVYAVMHLDGNRDMLDRQGEKFLELQNYLTPLAYDVAPSRRTSQTITLYVLADERKDATGFSTRYANWFPKQTIRDLAFASDGAPLLPAESKKLFVTVLTRTISGTGTLEDVFFRTATSQATMGIAPGATGAEVDWKFWAFVGGTAGLSLIFLGILLWRTRARATPQPPHSLTPSQ